MVAAGGFSKQPFLICLFVFSSPESQPAIFSLHKTGAARQGMLTAPSHLQDNNISNQILSEQLRRETELDGVLCSQVLLVTGLWVPLTVDQKNY